MAKFSKTLTKAEIFQGYLYLDADFTFHFSEVLFSPIELPSEIMVRFDNSRSYEACKYNQTSKRLFGFKEWYLEREIQKYDTIEIEVEEEKISVSYRNPRERRLDEFIPHPVTEGRADENNSEESVMYKYFDRSKIGHSEDDYYRRKIWILFLTEYHTVFIRAISRYYPLNQSLLIRFEHEWNWDEVSINQNVSLSEDILSTFRNSWNWWRLSQRSDLPWSDKFIEAFDDNWDWQCLSENNSIPWTEYLMEKYREKILWSLDEVGYQQQKDQEYSEWVGIQLDQAIYEAEVEDKEVEFSHIPPPENYYPEKSICSNTNINWNANLINVFSRLTLWT